MRLLWFALYGACASGAHRMSGCTEPVAADDRAYSCMLLLVHHPHTAVTSDTGSRFACLLVWPRPVVHDRVVTADGSAATAEALLRAREHARVPSFTRIRLLPAAMLPS
ncbi:hypothetical protein C8J57DRAFT_1558460 [Mycena rebaudengoi]|nr:hypothetical protein C8J57DRAFT_1558460 [Mycena rebaudengoi]